MESRRPPSRKNKKPITVIVHYPTTEEGDKLLRESQNTVIIDILEKKFGQEKLRLLMGLLEERICNKQ